MKDTELKACPFCGGRPKVDCHRGYRMMTTEKMGSGVAIYCTRCDAEMMLCREDLPECNTDELTEMLVSNWNKRPCGAGDRQPAMPQTPAISTLASATGSAAHVWLIQYANEDGISHLHQTIFEHEVRTMAKSALEHNAISLSILRSQNKVRESK